MKRNIKALEDGCCLEGKDGKDMDLAKGKPVDLSEEQWKNYCEAIRKKIGSGAVYLRQTKEDPKAAPKPAPAAQADAAKAAAQAKAQADAQAKAKADAKAAADAKAKAGQ